MKRGTYGFVAPWEIPTLTREDFTITYTLTQFKSDGEEVTSSTVMHPTEDIVIPPVTGSDKRAAGYYRLCTLVFKPTAKHNPPPLPNTSKHCVTFTIRYGSKLLHTYTLVWHEYDWIRIPQDLDVLNKDGKPVKDLNRVARVNIVNDKYKMPCPDVEDISKRIRHVPRLTIVGERGPNDWKPGQEDARDRRSMFTNQPIEYYIQSMTVHLDAVELHNTRKKESYDRKRAQVPEIATPDQLFRSASAPTLDRPKVTQKKKRRRRQVAVGTK